MLFGKRERRIKRILIVEDEPLVAFDNEHLLGAAGFEVAATVDGVDDATAVIAEGDLDLVLADVNLSDGGDGLDVARAAHASGVAVLFVTGSCPLEAQKLAVGCLAKPYGARDLVAAVEAIEARMEGKTPKRIPPGLSLYDA